VKNEIKEKMMKKEEYVMEYFFKFHAIFSLSTENVITNLKLFKLNLRPLELNVDGGILDLIRKILAFYFQKIAPKLPKHEAQPKSVESNDIDFTLDSFQEALSAKQFNEEGITIEKIVISDIGLILNFKNLHGLIKEVANIYALR